MGIVWNRNEKGHKKIAEFYTLRYRHFFLVLSAFWRGLTSFLTAYFLKKTVFRGMIFCSFTRPDKVPLLTKIVTAHFQKERIPPLFQEGGGPFLLRFFPY